MHICLTMTSYDTQTLSKCKSTFLPASWGGGKSISSGDQTLLAADIYRLAAYVTYLARCEDKGPQAATLAPPQTPPT